MMIFAYRERTKALDRYSSCRTRELLGLTYLGPFGRDIEPPVAGRTIEPDAPPLLQMVMLLRHVKSLKCALIVDFGGDEVRRLPTSALLLSCSCPIN